jgi:hypothetical protein
MTAPVMQRAKREAEVERMARRLIDASEGAVIIYEHATLDFRDRIAHHYAHQLARYVLRLLAAERRKAAKRAARDASSAISGVDTPEAVPAFEHGFDAGCRASQKAVRAILAGRK